MARPAVERAAGTQAPGRWRQIRSVVSLALVVGAGCAPDVQVDVGRRIPRSVVVSWMTWSLDDTTLYWQGPNAKTPLTAIDIPGGSMHAVIEGHDDLVSPTLVAGDTALFFTADWTDQYSGGRLYRASLANGRAGTATAVASNVWRFVASADGLLIAVVDAGTAALSSLDVATGTPRSLGEGTPLAFSPDGERLLISVNDPAGDGTRYFLVDPTTGARTAFVVPGNPLALTIVSWAGSSPSVVIPYGTGTILDVVSGEVRSLPNRLWRVDALSGDPADRTAAYLWGSECLRYTVNEENQSLCSAQQGSLYRVNLKNGGTDVVAKAAGNGAAIAVSRDGRRLATYLNFNNNVDDASLFIKNL